jgi:hypothetical protein
MPKPFFGEYKNVKEAFLPVFTICIVLQDLRTGKMSSQTSVTYVEMGAVPRFSDLKKFGLADLNKAVASLKALSEKEEAANGTHKPVALLTSGTEVPHA